MLSGMAQAGGHGVEHELEELKGSIERYRSEGSHLGADATADLAKAVHDLAGHVEALHRRLEAIENSQEQWTTHGWLPPAGSDVPPDDERP
jgi:hypothetical protein